MNSVEYVYDSQLGSPNSWGWGEAVPVLPLGELGSRLGCRAKGGTKITKKGTRTYQKITKEGCKTYENWLKRGANLINEEVLKDKKGG